MGINGVIETKVAIKIRTRFKEYFRNKMIRLYSVRRGREKSKMTCESLTYEALGCGPGWRLKMSSLCMIMKAMCIKEFTGPGMASWVLNGQVKRDAHAKKIQKCPEREENRLLLCFGCQSIF